MQKLRQESAKRCPKSVVSEIYVGRSDGRTDAPSNLGQTVTGGDADKPLRTDDVYIVTVLYVNSASEQTSTSAAIVAYPRRLQRADDVAQHRAPYANFYIQSYQTVYLTTKNCYGKQYKWCGEHSAPRTTIRLCYGAERKSQLSIFTIASLSSPLDPA